jgi:hypothetical protein
MRIRVGSGMALLMFLAAAPAAHGQRAADEMEGVLHLTVDEAWISGRGGRIRLIQVPPQTAVDVEPLLAQTAATLVDLAEKRVRVTGYLESNILWSAQVEELLEEGKQTDPLPGGERSPRRRSLDPFNPSGRLADVVVRGCAAGGELSGRAARQRRSRHDDSVPDRRSPGESLLLQPPATVGWARADWISRCRAVFPGTAI